MKKITKKLLVITIFCILSSFILTGCSSTKEDNTPDVSDGAKQSTDNEDASVSVYSTGVDETFQDGDWFPQWMFFKTLTWKRSIQSGTRWNLTLEVDADNNYTLTAELGNSDEGVIVGDASYHHAKTVAKGTCTTADGTITIDRPTYVDYKLGYGEFMEPYMEPWSFNSEAGAYDGEWTSDDMPEVLDIVPVTVFTVEGTKIVDFECEGIEDSLEEEGQDSSSVDGKESFFQQVSDGGSTYLDFYDDNAYMFTFPDQSISEDGTWAYDEATAVLTLITPSGKVCTSTETEEENVFLLDFKTDMNDVFGGKFHINLTDFSSVLPNSTSAQ